MDGDIRLEWDNDQGFADIPVVDSDLETDAGLETAVLISLFTDRRQFDGAALPTPADNPGGWWGDMVPDVAGDLIGSRLWLLGREKNEQSAAIRAEEYAREALDWMLVDKVASGIEVIASRIGNGVLLLEIGISRPGRDRATFKFDLNWAAQAA